MATLPVSERFSRLGSVGKLMALVVAVYVGLSFVQIVRGVASGGPDAYDAGFYAWEMATSPEGERRFHWTRGAGGSMLRRVDGAVLEVPVYVSHPALPPEGLEIDLQVNGREAGRWRPTRNGWVTLRTWVPAVAPEALGSKVWIDVATSAPFVPAELGAGDDSRELGVGVGAPGWTDLPEQGIGFFAYEGGGPVPFRWAGQRASQPVESAQPFAALSLWARVAHPASADEPVRVTFYWDAQELSTIAFEDNEWLDLELTLPAPTERGTLTSRVDRTWNPAVAGVAPDLRELGVALSAPAPHTAPEPR